MFKPTFGSWSIEDFSSSSGLNLDSYQTVTGGYLALNKLTGVTRSYTNRWSNPTGWDINNSLNSVAIIEENFIRIDAPSISGQVTDLATSGSAQLIVQGGSWNIVTNVPNQINGVYSGQQALGLKANYYNFDNSWSEYFKNGGDSATIELDVASIVNVYTGNTVFGFATGQETLTTLPALTGLLNHGIYINNGTNYEFIELNPDGIRLANHPEVSIPADLSYSTRIRIGIDGSNIYLSTEDGRGVGGIGKLDTPVTRTNEPEIFFGAPFIGGTSGTYPFTGSNISGFVGNSFWDNIKILYGSNILNNNPYELFYTTSIQTGYTNVFDPGVSLASWNHALVKHTKHHGGVTTVTAQYSGNNGWIDYNSLLLTGQGSPSSLSLVSIPISVNSSTGTHNKISNPIRFRIAQQSYGKSQPPSIDSIEVYAASEHSLIDIIPNWKPSNQAAKLQIFVDTGKFYTTKDYSDSLTTVFVNVPDSIGNKSGNYSFEEESRNGYTVTLSGESYIGYGGPSKNYLRNYVVTSGKAITNSEATTYFGESYVNNFFPNPLLENGFHSITGDSSYVSNRSFGDLADNLTMVPGYTGLATIFYQPIQTFDPAAQANSLRINEYLGNSQYPGSQIVQSVLVPGSSFSGNHNAKCGFEAVIPSGIASGNLIVSSDLRIQLGTGIQVYATGIGLSSNYRWNLEGSRYRDYRTVTFPIAGATGNIYIGYIVPSGTPSTETIKYDVDNILVSPVNTSYAKLNYVSGHLHQSGLYRDSVSGAATIAPIKSATVAAMDLKLVAYPTGSNNYIIKKTNNSGLGYSLYVNSNGYLGVTADTKAESWTTGSSSSTLISETLTSTGFLSDYILPLGEWLSVGMCHQVDTYSKLSYANYSGASDPINFASSNRLYLTVNGYPVGCLDMMRNWYSGHPTTNSAPYVSYINDTSGNLVIGSGILVEVDNVNIVRPVIGDTEIDLSIKHSKVTAPYFVPDFYFKPNANDEISNKLILSGNATLGKDLYLGSIYNFDNPGYPYWDHGPWKNHLIFYGSASKSTLNPYGYTGLGSTRLNSGSYAVAKYSSATERLINSTGNLGITNNLGIISGEFKVGGWIYPLNSGQEFFHIYRDSNNFTGVSLDIGFTNDMKYKISRKNGNTIWSLTGTYQHSVSGWNWFEAHIIPGNYTGNGQSSQMVVDFRSTSGSEISETVVGTNYGFSYQGRAGSSSESCIVFGYSADAAYCDWFVCPVFSGYRSFIAEPTGNKLGSYQSLLLDKERSSLSLDWGSFNYSTVTLGPTEVGNYFYSVGMHNYYDASSRMNYGILLYDDVPFRSTPAYFMSYNTNSFLENVGSNSSPIRIGNQVPPGAINLARFSNQKFTSEGAISTIDLSYMNKSNLAIYKDGLYTIERNGGSLSNYDSTGSYKGINSNVFLGRKNIEFSGQIQSENIDITSIAISDPRLNYPVEAFYCYLIGRGKHGVKINDYYSHATGHPDTYATGSSNISNYISNLEKVNSAISITDSNGEPIPFEDYAYSTVISPYTPEMLYTYSNSGESFDINGIGNLTGISGLPDGVFSTMLLLNKKSIAQDNSVWVHYQSFDYSNSKIDIGHKEIVNAIPIMRKKFEGGIPLPGQYELTTDADTYLHSITLYGINSGYSGKL